MNMINLTNLTKVPRTVIIGGGIVGASLALKLAQNKHPVTLIDARPKFSEEQWKSRLAKRDARVYALSLASINLLREIGVWQLIDKSGRKADYSQMQVWQTNGVGELNFSDENSSLDYSLSDSLLGSMVEPSVIEYAIEQQINNLISDECSETSNDYLRVIQGRKVTDLDWLGDNVLSNGLSNEQGYKVTLDDSDKLIAKLVIGADGRGSSIRRLAGIGLDTLDYGQTAVCCAIRTEKPHLAIARQAMLPTGTLALLPLADITNDDKLNPQYWQSVVWTLPSKQAIDMLTLNDRAIADKLAFACGYELGKIEHIESIASFSLTAQQANSYIKPNLALVGDSAHGVHPLAGQGLNLGMLDVVELTNLLMHDYQRSQGKQWGHFQTLNRYQRHRRANNNMMMHSFSMINWMFAGQFSQVAPIQHARSESMAFVSENKPLMKWFSKQASGLG